MKAKLKKIVKLSKKSWPQVTWEQLAEAGISRDEFWHNVTPATIHQTMGPNWCYGVNLVVSKNSWRPYRLNKQ